MDLEQEIKEIAQKVTSEELSKIPPVVFPDTQKVEVTNFPEQKAPIVKVEAPIINVPPANISVNPPEVVVNIPESKPISIDLNKLEEGVNELADILTDIKKQTTKSNEIKVIGGASWFPVVNALTDGTQKSVLYGTNDNGTKVAVPTTAEGHLEVALHAPRLPFGSIHTENLHPVFQSDGVYGVNSFTMTTAHGLGVGTGADSGTITSSNNKLVVSTGTTQYSFASLQSRRRLRYRAGQGVVGRFAGFFSTGIANSYQVLGFGTPESTLAFGYNGTSFGILYSTGGVREIQTLTVTTASTATNDYVITLPNTATVNVTATNNSSTTQTAYEISKGTFTGWKAHAVGSTVVFLADSAGNKSGTFSLAQTGAVTPAAGSVAETLAGVSPTDTWIPQSSWNGDKLDGTGASGVTLDPTKGNVYQIGIQYLGFGSIKFEIEVVNTTVNNAEFVTVHTIKYPNTASATSISQPSFPFLMAAYSAGSTSDISVSVGSFAGFNEGETLSLGPRISYDRDTVVTSSTSAYIPIFTVKNNLTFQGRANQSVINLINIAGSAKGNANAQTKFYVVRNPVLTGPVNFVSAGSNSSASWDVGATGMTTPTQNQKIWSIPLVETNVFDHPFVDKEITLQPGETVCVCVKGLSATSDCVMTMSTREDQ